VNRLLERWVRLTAPRPSGLPNGLVLAWFPLLVAAVVAVLVALSISGSSTGMFWTLLGKGPDPDLLAGTPQPVRSDEWLVQSGWVVSQDAEGFPAVNHVFPGGMDATVMNDLPAWHWSAAFRPHTWGFLLLGLDHGMAVRWWLPVALMVVAAYVLAVSLLPRRPVLGAVLSLGMVFQPLVQWWWLPIVPLPVAFAFAAMAAVVWGHRSTSWWGRILPAVVTAYLAVAMAMSIYVPFILPCVLAAAAFVVGFTLTERRATSRTWRSSLGALAPLVAAGAGAGAVVVTWVLTRRDTIDSLLSTVYPGQRLTPTGTQHAADLVALLGAPFQRALTRGDTDGVEVFAGLGPNQSEASSVLLVSLFLVVPMVGVAVRQWRADRVVDWLVAALLALQALVLAFLFVPGWDGLAHLTGLDRGSPQRMRLLFVVLAVVAVVVLVERLDRLQVRASWVSALVSGGLVLAATGWAWRRLDSLGSVVVPSTYAVLVTLALTAAVVLVSRRHALPGAALLLVAAIVVGAGANPLYRGVFDLREQSKAGRAVGELSRADPRASWVGVGSYLSMATLVEAGVPAYSGVQTYPSQEMWDRIDPEHTHEDAWNRLAHVYWQTGSGDPDPRQPPTQQADVIDVTFDSCAAFAQQWVTYVLADGAPIDQPCVRKVRGIKQGPMRQWIYQVVAPGDDR
jgi:hypothetical protein